VRPDKFVAILFDNQEKSQKLLLASIQDLFYTHTNGLKPLYINSHQLNELELKTKLNQDISCALTIGTDVTKRVLSTRPEIPLFSINVSKLELDKFHSVYQRLSVFISGIYEEQSLLRQVLLAKAILPDLQAVSVLYNQADKYYLKEDTNQLKGLGMKLNYSLLQNSDSPQKFLADLSPQDNNFLMLSNNRLLFNKSRLAGLVLTANQMKTKIIGSRQVDIAQGAIASVYTPETSLALEALEDIERLCQSEFRPNPRYARNFNVGVNKHIASASASNKQEIEANELYRSIIEQESRLILKVPNE